MKAASLHPWDVSWEEAERIQNELRQLVSQVNGFYEIRYVAGVDIGFRAPETSPTTPRERGFGARFRGDLARAAAIVLEYPDLQLVEVAIAERLAAFPYRPGFLSFREAPAAIAALESLRIEPDLVVVDGQGIAHPRRLGIAAHLGVLFDKPTIGCAKSRLVGRIGEVGEEPGDWGPITDKGEVIGAAVRTRRRSKPLYISVGNRVDLQTAVRLILSLTRGYRLPEPTRLAHLAAGGQLAPPGSSR